MRPFVCGWGVSGIALRSARHIYISLRARYRWQFCLNSIKLYMSYVDDSRRNLIDFGSRGQRSRSTSAQDARAYSTLRSSCLNYLLISIASFQWTFKIFPGKVISSLIRSTYVLCIQSKSNYREIVTIVPQNACGFSKSKTWHTDRQTDGRTDRRRTTWSLCGALLRRVIKTCVACCMGQTNALTGCNPPFFW